MSQILHTSIVQKTASLVDEGNYAYFQSRGARNIKTHIDLWKLTLRGHVNTDAQAWDQIRNFFITRTTLGFKK